MKHYTILNPYWWGSFVIFLIILICSMTMLIDHKVLFSCGLTFGDSNVYTWESSKGNLESLLSKLLNFFSFVQQWYQFWYQCCASNKANRTLYWEACNPTILISHIIFQFGLNKISKFDRVYLPSSKRVTLLGYNHIIEEVKNILYIYMYHFTAYKIFVQWVTCT